MKKSRLILCCIVGLLLQSCWSNTIEDEIRDSIAADAAADSMLKVTDSLLKANAAHTGQSSH